MLSHNIDARISTPPALQFAVSAPVPKIQKKRRKKGPRLSRRPKRKPDSTAVKIAPAGKNPAPNANKPAPVVFWHAANNSGASAPADNNHASLTSNVEREDSSDDDQHVPTGSAIHAHMVDAAYHNGMLFAILDNHDAHHLEHIFEGAQKCC
jgi:hypothetical protein